ncbi:hypothetical protein BOO35_19440 [Vibrio navarrensis]|uniref:hypothetical protein n=1 Tax=Vibrio navarrensis TaxID=29495 RepID=UPI001DC05020|nr:hypothetical protein [Vibrio navarrensis]MBE3667233.1 hypothetical protein [Vibrio navarrensis]
MAQSRFGSFAFALSSPKMSSQNLLVSKQMNARKFELIRFSKLKRFVGFPNRVNLSFGNSKLLKFKLTSCLSGIRNAWHFYHAVSFVIKLVCGGFCSALLTP